MRARELPWVVQREEEISPDGRSEAFWWVRDGKGGAVTLAFGEGDARLVAAAPELLFQLEYLYESWKYLVGHKRNLIAVERAIAAAKGKEATRG